jgi:hypothetical protein
MSFPNTYREIKEMARKAMLETRMARAIVRKAGIRIGAPTGVGIPSAGLLLSMTSMSNTPFQENEWQTVLTEGVVGVWPTTVLPEEWPASIAHTLLYLSGLTYARVVIQTEGQTGNDSRNLVAFVPVYTTAMNPLGQGIDNPQSLEVWTCPDGRTLYEWHLDSMAGGPKAYSWPPAGSCVYTTFSTESYSGRWAPPPLDALDASSVLLGVGVISRVGQAEEGTTQVFITGVQVQGIIDEWNTDGFQTFYASQIDEP